MLSRPALLARTLGTDRVTARNTGWLTQMVGARELALGVGTLTATSVRPWLLAQAVADAGDGFALLAAARIRRVSPALGGLLALTAAAGAAVDVLAWHGARERVNAV
jgi:hypothetical protein